MHPMDLEQLYQDNFTKVQSFCQKWTEDADDAHDIAQESFIELMKRNGGEGLVNPLSWVYRVAYNRCVNRHKFNLRFVASSDTSSNINPFADDGEVNQERLREVRRAIHKLSHKERALVTLYKMGFSYAEMAHVVEMNSASVGKTLTRAIDKLAKWVK